MEIHNDYVESALRDARLALQAARDALDMNIDFPHVGASLERKCLEYIHSCEGLIEFVKMERKFYAKENPDFHTLSPNHKKILYEIIPSILATSRDILLKVIN